MAVIYSPSGVVAMMVFPEREAELDDLAFNPPGHTHVRLDPALIENGDHAAIAALTSPEVADQVLRVKSAAELGLVPYKQDQQVPRDQAELDKEAEFLAALDVSPDPVSLHTKVMVEKKPLAQAIAEVAVEAVTPK